MANNDTYRTLWADKGGRGCANARMEVGEAHEDHPLAWVELNLGPNFAGEVCGSTTGEAEALASAVAARWNAAADALRLLETTGYPRYDVEGLLRAALAPRP